jgi:GT2 family glycosyltransferase
MERVTTTAHLPPVAVAMVNWNGCQDTINCLESLERLTYPDPALIVCDNASTDNSVERLAKWAADRGWTWNVVDEPGHHFQNPTDTAKDCRLLIIRSSQNRGFTGGTNLAIRYALEGGRQPAYIWVLNTDTLVEPNSLRQAVEALEANSALGSAQSLLLWARQPDLLDSAGLRLLRRGGAQDILHHRARVELDRRINGRQVVEIFGCCGAAAIYRVNALQVVGVFDESLFQSYEDVDLACRLRQGGFAAVLVPHSIVYHIGGISRDRKKRGLRWWTSHRNKLRLVARWYPTCLAFPILALGVIRALIAAVRSKDVPLAMWSRLPATLWRDRRDGPKSSARWQVLKQGTKDFLG